MCLITFHLAKFYHAQELSDYSFCQVFFITYYSILKGNPEVAYYAQNYSQDCDKYQHHSLDFISMTIILKFSTTY